MTVDQIDLGRNNSIVSIRTLPVPNTAIAMASTEGTIRLVVEVSKATPYLCMRIRIPQSFKKAAPRKFCWKEFPPRGVRYDI